MGSVLRALFLTDAPPVVLKSLKGELDTEKDLLGCSLTGGSSRELHKRTISCFNDMDETTGGCRKVGKTILKLTKGANIRLGVLCSILMGLCFGVLRPLVVKEVITEMVAAETVNINYVLVLVCGTIFLEGMLLIQSVEYIATRFFTDYVGIVSCLVTDKIPKIPSKSVTDEATLIAVDGVSKAALMRDSFSFLPANLVGLLAGGGFLIGHCGWAGVLGFIFTLILQITGLILLGRAKGYEERALEVTGERMRVTREVLSNIKGLKFSGWEPAYFSQLRQHRSEETDAFEAFHKVKLLGANVGRTLPMIGTCFTLLIHYLMGHEITASTVFPVLTVFQGMRSSFVLIPINLMYWLGLKTSIARVQELMDAKEIAPVSTGVGGKSTESNAASSLDVECSPASPPTGCVTWGYEESRKVSAVTSHSMDSMPSANEESKSVALSQKTEECVSNVEGKGISEIASVGSKSMVPSMYNAPPRVRVGGLLVRLLVLVEFRSLLLQL